MDDDLQRRWAIARAISEHTLDRLRDVKVEPRNTTTGEPDALQRWDALRPKPEEPKPEPKLDTQPTNSGEGDWDGWERWLAARLATERDRICETVGLAIGELLEGERQATRALANEVHDLRLEAAKLGNEVATLREALALERTVKLDLPNPLSRRVVN